MLQINWRLAEHNLPVNQFTVPGVYPVGANDYSLHFRSAKPNNTALYLCTGSNKLGKENRIFSVKVIGNELINIHRWLNKILLKLNFNYNETYKVLSSYFTHSRSTTFFLFY